MTSEFAIAVHALVFLEHKGIVISSEELAKNVCTNPARIRKVMAKLKRADLIRTKEGTEGGYLFFREAEEVTLAMVAEALQISFVSTSWRSGSPEKKCCVASGMADVMAGIYGDLNACCKDLLKQRTIADVKRELFHFAKEKGTFWKRRMEERNDGRKVKETCGIL